MRSRTLFFCLLSLGIVSIAELAVVMTTVSPHNASTETYWAFFLSLLGTLTALFTACLYPIKRKLFHKFTKPNLTTAVRQAALLSVIIVLCLFFRSLGILSLWDIAPLCISAVLIEFFFQADKNPKPITIHGPS